MDEFSILDSWMSFTVIGLAHYPKIEFSKKWMKNCNFENDSGYWTELDWETDSCRTFLFQVSGWWIELCFRQSNVFHCTWKNKFEKKCISWRLSRSVGNPRTERSINQEIKGPTFLSQSKLMKFRFELNLKQNLANWSKGKLAHFRLARFSIFRRYKDLLLPR